MLPADHTTNGLFAGGRWYAQPDRCLLRDVVRILSVEVVHRLTVMGRSLSAEPGLGFSVKLTSHEEISPCSPIRASMAPAPWRSCSRHHPEICPGRGLWRSEG